MKINMPVTTVEHHFDRTTPIVTKTNLKGIITYANPAFVRISGFSEAELIGQSHNVVRHPDMPPAAFDDMWTTLKRGDPWRGLVKNRSKCGGFYWVEAYVTPIREQGKVVGYMSVRTPPDALAKQQAETLYADIRAGRQAFPVTKPSRNLTIMQLVLLAGLPMLLVQLVLLAGAETLFEGVMAGVGIFCLAAMSIFLYRNVGPSTQYAREQLQRLGEGDFKQAIRPCGSREQSALLGEMESMRINLRAVIADVVASSRTIASASEHTRQEATVLDENSQQASDGISRVAAALEELSVSVNEIADSTRLSANHAGHACELAGEGMANMQSATTATAEVTKKVDATRNAIGELESAVDEIRAMTVMIKDIAEQTNLLALNAAIEAARAGEVGRGFAVVADEVRKLAERTKGNASQIEASIRHLLDGTEQAKNSANASSISVQQAEAAIATVSTSLHSIQQASVALAHSAEDISGMLKQQSAVSTEVSQNMEVMSALTEQNGSSIRSARDIADGLASTADDLGKLVHHFERHL